MGQQTFATHRTALHGPNRREEVHPLRRILLLIKSLDRGGAEQLLLRALRHRDRARFDYQVAYLLCGHQALAEEIRDLNVPVHCLAGRRPGEWVDRLAALVRVNSIDLVHVHSPHMAIGARLRFPRRMDPPLVYTEHSLWEGYRRATYWGNLLTYPRNDHVFAVSQHVRSSIRYPGPLSRRPLPPMETLYHGVDARSLVVGAGRDGARRELGIAEAAPVVGCVANFTPQKDHGTLLEATALIRRAVPDFRLVLVGGGPLEVDVRREARARGLTSTVVFTGPRVDVPRLMDCFDVFVLSSMQEGLSIALVEAMALGKPPVVTRVGGLPEVVVDGAGVVVPARDPRVMADELVRLIADPARRRRIGEAARRRAEDFDIRRAVARIEEVYAELLG